MSRTWAQSVYCRVCYSFALATENLTSSFPSDHSTASTDDWWPTFRECGGIIFNVLNSSDWKFDFHKLDHYTVYKQRAQITQLRGIVTDMSWSKSLQMKNSCKMMIALSASRQYASLWSGCTYNRTYSSQYACTLFLYFYSTLNIKSTID